MPIPAAVSIELTDEERAVGWARRHKSAWALRARIVLMARGGVVEPRPGKSRTITDEQVERVVTKTLESAPKNATHWSTRSMAREMGMTPDSRCRCFRHARARDPQL